MSEYALAAFVAVILIFTILLPSNQATVKALQATEQVFLEQYD